MILADIGLPRQDGYAFMKSLRSRWTGRELAGVPVIAVTAYAGADNERRVDRGRLPQAVHEAAGTRCGRARDRRTSFARAELAA